jgi:hypothetical protein
VFQHVFGLLQSACPAPVERKYKQMKKNKDCGIIK